MRTLFTGGAVFTEGKLLPDTDVLVDGTTIASIGATDGRPADRTIDVTGCLVLPGLINTHQHDWYVYGRGLGGGMLLEQWISDCLFPMKSHVTVDDLRLASEVASLDMLRGGTTTSVNHQVNETTLAEEEAILQPVADTGIRQFFGKVIRPHDASDGYASAQESFAKWDGYADGRVQVGFVLEATAHWVHMGTCSEEMVIGGHALAVAKDTFVSSHIAGGTMSRDSGYLKFVLETGRTDLQFLHRLGVLDDRWILAHTIHPRDNDLDLIAASGSTVAHTPSSEAARGGGITPVARMLSNGVHVSVGTDGPMVDLSNDMVEQLKWTRLLQNQVHLSPSSISLEKIVSMGTSAGARAVRAEDRIGTLAPGMAADIAVFDLHTLHSMPVHDVLSTFVHTSRGRDARHVMVDGELLVENGKFTRVNDLYITSLLDQAGARGQALARRAGLLPA
ncbi:amidohydrolase family protein [Kibdelosporangium aridum]|uniref:Cytosine/adenosine deaminase n=1 Tax=Kibdelosporangium aridum TaxID=2030 RepID=A0A1W2FUS2_KIBAR|nr:amidohydrolase family protein [Kibdelosporangium aridum]SMD25358.1 Cytosine/adenosine deaminase [Kibdelosporangium aridum]